MRASRSAAWWSTDPVDVQNWTRRKALSTLVFLMGWVGAAAAEGIPPLAFDAGRFGRLEIGADGIEGAVATRTDTGTSVVWKITPPNARAFGDLSERAIGHPVMIVVCGQDLLAPVVHARIDGGAGQFAHSDNDLVAEWVAALNGEAPCPG